MKYSSCSKPVCYSISDDLMWRYFSLLSFKSTDEINSYKEDVKKGANPRDIKFLLAEEIVERFHNGLGKTSKDNFINRFQKGNISEDIDEIELKIDDESELLTRILREVKLVKSTSDAMRMISQGAVKVEKKKILDPKFRINKGTSSLVQVGKKKISKILIK